MKELRLGTIYGSRLNLDGDQGNLLALKRYLEAAGFDVNIHSVANSESALSSDFLLFGHGSKAAMASIQEDLAGMEWKRILGQVPGLAVGSGYKWLAENALVDQRVQTEDRVSEFQEASYGPLRVLGYRNSDSGLPNLTQNGAFFCTMLHGPVLAKNPVLLDRAAKAAVHSAGLTWPQEVPDDLKSWIETLNDVCLRIWNLEAESDYPALRY